MTNIDEISTNSTCNNLSSLYASDEKGLINSKALSDLNNSSPISSLPKDSNWLTLEICREHLRNKCPRNEIECKFAHPPRFYPIEINHGRVICCYDFIKGKCNRKSPPCKYLHPPQHLKEQLVQNGRKNLLLKNIQQNILYNHLQSYSFGGTFSPLNLTNIYQNRQHSTGLPSSTINSMSKFYPCIFPVGLFSPITSDVTLIGKEPAIPINAQILPNIFLQPIIQTNPALVPSENLYNMMSRSISQNNFDL